MTLCEFIQEAQRLSFPRCPNLETLEPIKLSRNNLKRMKPKKMHEVSHMTALVNQVCQEAGCSRIADVGAGLVSIHFFCMVHHLRVG